MAKLAGKTKEYLENWLWISFTCCQKISYLINPDVEMNWHWQLLRISVKSKWYKEIGCKILPFIMF
nr:hypothetical protein [Mycoplasmopsis bovis]